MEMNILHQNHYMQWDTLAINEISHSFSNFEPCTMCYKYGRCKHNLYGVDIVDSKITLQNMLFHFNRYILLYRGSFNIPTIHSHTQHILSTYLPLL